MDTDIKAIPTQSTPPRGTFPGQNFMTPTWLGYYRVRGGWAELTTGTGMRQQPIFGVTVRKAGGEDLLGADGKRLSRLFESRSAAEEYIAGLQ